MIARYLLPPAFGDPTAMFAFDIPTLYLISTLAVSITMSSFYLVWRLVPSERSLRDWSIGGVVLAAGTVLIALRKVVPETFSIVAGNSLLVLGLGYLHVGARGLLGRSPAWPWHWLAAFATVAGCFWYAMIDPSLPARIALVSLLSVPFLLACGWLFARHRDPDLRVTQGITAAVFFLGAVLMLARAAAAPNATVTPDFSASSNVLIVFPNLYMIIFSLWLGVTVPQAVSARLQRRLANALEQAEAASRAKSVFLSSMSHELRTPMNAVLGFAQILEFDEGLNGEQRGHVQEILRGGRHLLDLINDVLDLARIESGRVHLDMGKFDIAPVIAECGDMIQPLVAGHGLKLAVEVPENLTVHADPVRLKQVLLNLLSNAVKYNREGGEVRLAVSRAGDRLRIEVSDTGVGIAPEQMAELFKPFSRLGQEASGIEGTGIGLTITQRLVQMMGGTIGMESRLGIGSNVWVDLAADMSADGSAAT